MAKLRKAVAYRSIERPYTRRSKFKKHNFVRSSPNNLVVRYEMGNHKKKFEYTLILRTKTALQLRHNAIEAARQSSNRVLEKDLGKVGFFMKINVYPHHILRENPLASGAGADRMSTGMKKSFGKPISIAAQLKVNQPIFTVSVDKDDIPIARAALRRVYTKIPCSCSIELIDNKEIDNKEKK